MTLYSRNWYINEAKRVMREADQITERSGYGDEGAKQRFQQAQAYALIAQAMRDD